MSVESGSGAEKAGLQAGDVITELDGTAITSSAQLRAIIAVDKPGQTVTLTISRNGDTKYIKATLGNRPAGSYETVRADGRGRQRARRSKEKRRVG